MKLEIKRSEKMLTNEEKIADLEKQNIELSKRVLSLLKTQTEMAKKEEENSKIILRVNDFVKEVGNRFRELSEYFDDNQNTNVGALDYDKIALVLHKYDLVGNRKK